MNAIALVLFRYLRYLLCRTNLFDEIVPFDRVWQCSGASSNSVCRVSSVLYNNILAVIKSDENEKSTKSSAKAASFSVHYIQPTEKNVNVWHAPSVTFVAAEAHIADKWADTIEARYKPEGITLCLIVSFPSESTVTF